jgi:hypothetical protein
VSEQVNALGSLDFGGDVLLWHYTNGDRLIGIVESGTLYSTQVSCVNDSSEVRYGQALFKKALTDLVSKYERNDAVKQLLRRYLKLFEEDPKMPSHAGCHHRESVIPILSAVLASSPKVRAGCVMWPPHLCGLGPVMP